MKVFLLLAVVVLIHCNYATLLIKGPTEPVMMGQKVILECQYNNSDLDISEVYFEKFEKLSGQWMLVFRSYTHCIPGLRAAHYASKIGNRRVFDISYVTAYNDGFYRCVSKNKNVTAPDNSSQELSLKVNYLQDLRIIDSSVAKPVYRRISVQAGVDVELKCFVRSSEEPTITWSKNEDINVTTPMAGEVALYDRGPMDDGWILPFSTLTLKKINMLDAGLYTCLAQHPLYPSLTKNVSVIVEVYDMATRLKALDRANTVETSKENIPWYKTNSTELWVTVAAVATCFLVFTLSLSIFLCRRFGKAHTSKGPIDDHSQKKPIYKTSVDSLSSACGDAQPLV